MSKIIKAWCVHDGFPDEETVIVFAATRARAKELAEAASFPYLTRPDDVHLLVASRVKEYDGACLKERVCRNNSELPRGVRKFFGRKKS